MKEIPIITEYLQHTKHIMDFDPTDNMDNLLPVIDIVPGWQQDISHCRSYDELPDNAKLLDHEIQFISVGAERNQYLTKGEWL